MRVRLLAPLTAALVAGTIGLTATAATAAPSAATSPAAAQAAAQPSRALAIPVTGTVAGVAQTGTLTVTSFAQHAGQLVANGKLSLGSVTNQQVQVPIDPAATTASCQILDLVLGPLDLNLLGLVVHLDTVHLNITAVPGPGNLLGNLLCAVANLLNGGTGLNGLTGLLNRLLGAL